MNLESEKINLYLLIIHTYTSRFWPSKIGSPLSYMKLSFNNLGPITQKGYTDSNCTCEIIIICVGIRKLIIKDFVFLLNLKTTTSRKLHPHEYLANITQPMKTDPLQIKWFHSNTHRDINFKCKNQNNDNF